jgi:peptidoglycan/xylan/chitin deacetylase (PgdA/CDA1 family)
VQRRGKDDHAHSTWDSALVTSLHSEQWTASLPHIDIMAKTAHILLVSILSSGFCSAQTRIFTVLPWNDHRAAVSLTFDDARPVQLDVAVPELNKRHLRATFFVIVSKLTRLDEWRQAQAEGHEIGNHTVTHEHPAVLTKEGEEFQVEDAKNFLDSNFRANIITFAYPYMEISPGVLFWVKRYNFAARGWPQDPNLLYVMPDADPDWYNLPGRPAYTKYDLGVYQGWIKKALSLGAWTTFQFHGIGDPSTGWEPIPTNTFTALLNYLQAAQDQALWIAPFGEVAAYLRAERVLEEVGPQTRNGEQRFTWNVPAPFPSGVVLKIRLATGRSLHLYQHGRELRADRRHIYSVAFDARELVVRGAL